MTDQKIPVNPSKDQKFLVRLIDRKDGSVVHRDYKGKSWDEVLDKVKEKYNESKKAIHVFKKVYPSN